MWIAAAVAVLAAPSPAQYLYVHSFNGDNVQRYNDTTGVAAPFSSPITVTAGGGSVIGLTSPNDLFVTSGKPLTAAPHSIKRYNRTTGALIGDFVATLGASNTGPQQPVFGPDGHLYVPIWNSGSAPLLRFDGTTGAALSNAATGLQFPFDVAFSPHDSNVYVTDGFSSRVRRFNPATGALVGTFVAAGSGGLSNGVGLKFGPDGDLYVASAGSDAVLRYNGTTGAFIGIFTSGGSLDQPYDMAWGPDGHMYVAHNAGAVAGSGAIKRYNGTTGVFIDNFITGLTDPTCIAFDFALIPVELSAFTLE